MRARSRGVSTDPGEGKQDTISSRRVSLKEKVPPPLRDFVVHMEGAYIQLFRLYLTYVLYIYVLFTGISCIILFASGACMIPIQYFYRGNPPTRILWLHPLSGGDSGTRGKRDVGLYDTIPCQMVSTSTMLQS